MKVIGTSSFNRFNRIFIKKSICIFINNEKNSNIIIAFIKDGLYHNKNYQALYVDKLIKHFYYKDVMVKNISSLKNLKKQLNN